MTAHHITPRDQGGQDEARNLVTLCAPCHDWAEVETAERGLSWAELLSWPAAKDDETRVWYLDADGIVSAEIL